MTVYNLGSINIDLVYQVPHLPEPGETLAALTFTEGLGGKGANQSAAARPRAQTVHIGAMGQGADWVIDRLCAARIETGHIAAALAGAGPTDSMLCKMKPRCRQSPRPLPGKKVCA